jgi:hypothetical protein
MNRLDEPFAVSLHKDRFHGGKALIVLGGSSGKDWQKLRDQIKPDVILGANGTCFEIDNLDYHLVCENLHMAAGKANLGDKRYKRIVEILSFNHNAEVRMISFLNWKGTILVDDRIKAIKIKRMGELGENWNSQFERFCFREYGDGFLSGPMFDHPGALSSSRIQFRVGTVGTQLLHLAGILGVKEVHTIGFDLCFKDVEKHHWYSYPIYQPDRFRTNLMFTEYNYLKTQFDWIQGADFLKSIQSLFERDKLNWIDHSEGLLKEKELWCAQ